MNWMLRGFRWKLIWWGWYVKCERREWVFNKSVVKVNFFVKMVLLRLIEKIFIGFYVVDNFLVFVDVLIKKFFLSKDY